MMKKGIFIGFLAFACAATTTAYADSNDVVGVDATFSTKTNSSADATNFDVKVYNNKNVLVAEQAGVTTTGHTDAYINNSVDTVALDLKGKFTKSDLAGGKVVVTIHPDGKQQWVFNNNIDVTYSDGSVVYHRWDKDKTLTQNSPTATDTWSD